MYFLFLTTIISIIVVYILVVLHGVVIMLTYNNTSLEMSFAFFSSLIIFSCFSIMRTDLISINSS